MGKVYKDKKGSSCSMCKPHKNGHSPKHKIKYIDLKKQHDKEVLEFKIIAA